MQKITELPTLSYRAKDGHKGTYGRVLVIAGSLGMTGAASLTTQATLRSGAGLVTLGIAASLLPIVASKITCAMTLPLEGQVGCLSSKAYNTIIDFSKNMDVIALGPGISTSSITIKLTQKLLPDIKSPLVLDADGLNNIANNLEVLAKRDAPTVITPHPGEFCRLTNKKIADLREHKEELAYKFAKDYKCVVVLKFAPTIVTDGQRIFSNTTGNPGMATGGSGDVLTGVITALLAQGFSPFDAAQLGVWIHGYAGDIACKDKGEIGMIASDILDALPRAFMDYQTIRK